MKRLLRTMLTLLPLVATTVFAAPAQHEKAPSKQNVHQVKNKAGQKTSAKKLHANAPSSKKETAKKEAQEKKAGNLKNKKATVSKPLEKDKNAKKSTKKPVIAAHSSTKSNKTTAHKMAKKVDHSKAQPKAMPTDVEKAQTLSQTPKAEPKLVVVPQCQEAQVFHVLADAFKQQGNATGTPMQVKQILQAHETQHYPQQGIRSCHALVETNGKKYQTDYSVILSGNRFFVQVENAQAAF